MEINAGNLKKSDFIYYQGQIWQVQKAEFYSPGKGAALMKTRIKNLVSGKNIEYTYKSNEKVEIAEIESRQMQYLYKDNTNLYFMDERTFNQYLIPISVVGAAAQFLKGGEKIYVYLHEDKPLTLQLPMNVRLKIIKTEEAVKGDTVSGAKKPATLETGVTIMVPLFVKTGDTVVVNPEIGEYVERVK